MTFRLHHSLLGLAFVFCFLCVYPSISLAQPRAPKGVKADTAAVAESLGPSINSTLHEYCPVISPDGQTIFFVRRGLQDMSREKIWYSKRNKKGEFELAKDIGVPLNSTEPNAVLAVTPDGNTLLLHGTYGFGNGLSMSQKTANGWGIPKKLNIANFYSRSSYENAYLTNDGKVLVISAERNDSYGRENDLYVSFRKPTGDWTEPMNLGSQINTPAAESAPFVAADGTSLYFASSGHGGLGGLDIFVTRRLDTTWRNWSTPVNLGPTINTNKDDNFFFIPASGDYTYYSSIRKGFPDYDINRIRLPEFARPKPVVLVTGRVLNKKTKKPVAARIFYETLSDGKEVGIANSDPETGAYKIALPAGSVYGFRAEADGYAAISDNLDLTKLKVYKEIKRDLFLVPIEEGESVRINNLFFDFAKADLNPESFPELDRLGTMLQTNPAMKIRVQGHTDNIGSPDRNLTLSQDRAKAVATYLVGHGTSEDRITTKGFGATKPIAPNSTDEGRQQNRRVEFVIVHR